MFDRVFERIFGSVRGLGVFLILAAMGVALLASIIVPASSPFVFPLVVVIMIATFLGFILVLVSFAYSE